MAGCQECTHAACKTFTMDDADGTARVTRQWGDAEPTIKVLQDSLIVYVIWEISGKCLENDGIKCSRGGVVLSS